MRGLLDFLLLVRMIYRTVRWFVTMWWRWLTGAALDGIVRTDAGWTTSGTQPLVRGRVGRWSYLPRLHRAGWRHGITLAAVLVFIGLAISARLTLFILLILALGAMAHAAWRTWQARQLRLHKKNIVQPLYITVRNVLGPQAYPMEQMDRFLTVPLDYATNPGTRITLSLPPTFSGDAKVVAALSRIMQQKLGIELDGHWSYVGSPYVEYTPKPQPPSSVSYADIAERIEAADDGELVIGLGTRDETVSIYLDTETPHVGMNMGTGGGKSSTLRGMIAQLRKQDAEIVIADVGQISLNEFEGVPGVTIVTDVADIWMIIEKLQAEMERRYAEWKGNPNAKFRRLVFVLEEANDFYLQSVGYWESIKEKKDPSTPPIYMKMAQFMVKSRKVKMHAVHVYQSMEARYTGGPQVGPLIRSQYGMKILARFTPQQWGFLVGTNPRPKSSRHPGRAIVMVGDEMRVTQMAFWTPEQARMVALGDDAPSSVTSEEIIDHHRQDGHDVTPVTGRPSLYVVKGGASENGPESVEETLENEEWTVREGATIVGPPRRYTLAEAARERILPLSYGAMREAKRVASQRGNPFPTGRTIDGKTTYTAKELETWYEKRQAKASGE